MRLNTKDRAFGISGIRQNFHPRALYTGDELGICESLLPDVETEDTKTGITLGAPRGKRVSTRGI